MATSGSKSIAATPNDTLKFSWWENSQSVANNTTTIDWKLELIADAYGRISSTASKTWSVTVNGTKYSGTNTIGLANNATKTLASGTTTISHNSDGTKSFSYSFSQELAITFSGSYIGTKSGSGTGTLDTIPRKSSLSVGNGTLGTEQTLTVTRQSSSFTHTIVASCGDQSKTICTKSTDTSIEFTPPIAWASENTTGTSVSVKYTITTYNGNTSVGSNSYTKTCSIPSSVKPTVSFTVDDPTGFDDVYGGYVQSKSKFKVVISASGSNGSTIKNYKATVDGKTFTASSFTTAVISGSGSITISVTVTDSRGRTATASKTVTVLAYAVPKISAINVIRCDASGNASSSGSYLKVVFGATITSLNSKNTARYVINYKKTSEASYESTTTELTNYEGMYSVSNASFIFAADNSSSYDIILTAIDAFGEVSKPASGSSVRKAWSQFRQGLGFAFGKIAELEGVFEVAFQTKLTGGILQPVLEDGSDFDDQKTPNTYSLKNTTNAKYVNCPFTSGTGTLKVEACGFEGQIRQIVTVCNKTNPRKFERLFYSGSWGAWICTDRYTSNLLWYGNYYMTSGHTIDLAEAISKQRKGIVLVFSAYEDSVVKDHHFESCFIPKDIVELHEGGGHNLKLCTSDFSYIGTKYLYISDTTIKGHDNNNKTGTKNGVTYANNHWVLRYVFGV